MNYFLYKSFLGCVFTKEFVKRIQNRISILYPASRTYIIKKTSDTLLRVFIVSIIAVAGMMMFADMSLYYVLITIAMIYVISTSVVYSSLDKTETKLLTGLEQFITDVRYRFRFDGMVEEAIEDAINISEYEMSLHGNLILDTLRENMKKNYDSPYKEYAPNHFFMTFYVMCETVIIYGDKIVDGKSTFLRNICYLKEDIHIEILRRKKLQNEFMGLTGITILPVFAIKPIEVWAKYNMPELAGEYDSVKGIIITLCLVMLSVVTFMIIKRLRYTSDIEDTKSEWVSQMLKNSFVENILIRIIATNYSKYFKLDRILKSIVYKYNIKEFMLVRIVYSSIGFFLGLILGVSIGIGFFSIILGITIWFLVYFGMYVSILFKRQMMLISREEEIVRFQTIILILMHMDRINIEKILENMEAFAVVFKDIIEKMSDHLAYKGKKIFEEAKDEVSFIPFERLIDAFIASDRIGIADAFEDVESDRTYYVEKHKQENEEIVKNKALIAKFIAFIPLCGVIIFKLVIPFIIMGMTQLENFNMTI